MARPTEIPLARAASLYAAQRYAEAAGSYRAVLSIDPTDHRPYLGLADCAVGRGLRNEAVDELVGAAADFRDREDYDGAFALLARALAIDPDRLELHIDVAELEAANGRVEMAVGRLENLAAAYEQSSQYEEAAAIHEVIEAWTANDPADPVDPVEAVPDPVKRGLTQPVVVRPAPPEPPPLPPTRPAERLLVQTTLPASPRRVTTAITESVLLRKAPPPPPRVVRGAMPKKTEDPVAKPVATPPPAPRRGPRRDAIAPRWRPSTVQGKALPELPRRQAKAKTQVRATPAPSARRKSIVEPAPSPTRGAVKLDKLPALTGPAPARKRAAAIPRRTPTKHTALLHPNLPSGTETKRTVAKVQIDKRVVAQAPRPAARPAVAKPKPQPPKSKLAERLRRTSASPSGAFSPVHVEPEDEPTRLWAPDGLLI